MNQIALSKRLMAALFACILAAACGAFASQQTAYADVTAADTDALTAQDDELAAQEEAEALEEAADIYRMYNPNSGEHFYTGSFKEAMGLVKAGWNYEGVAWTSAAKGQKVSDTNTKESAPLYRLYNPYTGDHHYTMSQEEKDGLVDKGWKSEGISFYAFNPKDVSDSDLGSEAGQLARVHREYNPNATVGTHNYTMSKDEHDGLIKKGWKDEECGFVATRAKEISDYSVLSLPLNRMYNPNSGEHFYTANLDEVANLVKAGWDFEGEAWTTFAKEDTGAKPVFRLYNPNSGDHHYTLSSDEKDNLIEAGWKDEGTAFYAAPKEKAEEAEQQEVSAEKPAYTFEPVYRAYNPNAKAGSHHFTVKKDEVKRLVELGWKDEGIAWCGKKAVSE